MLANRSAGPVLGVRLVILCLAILAVGLAFSLARRRRAAESDFHSTYICPMHAQVTAAAPGACPICGMSLVRADGAGDGASGSDPGSHSVTPAADEISAARLRLVEGSISAPAQILDDGDAEAIVYNDELAALRPEEPGSFVKPAEPAARWPVVRAAVDAVIWDGSTSRVRFRVDRSSGALVAGTTGRVLLAPPARVALMVPSGALVQSKDGPYLLAARAARGAQAPGEREFSRRPVTVGQVKLGFAAVVTGVSDGEQVVARGAFFRDAERRMFVLRE